MLLGDGGGGFSVTPSGPFLVGAGVLGITVGDFDRDGARRGGAQCVVWL